MGIERRMAKIMESKAKGTVTCNLEKIKELIGTS
jgi:hypothetical protein